MTTETTLRPGQVLPASWAGPPPRGSRRTLAGRALRAGKVSAGMVRFTPETIYVPRGLAYEDIPLFVNAMPKAFVGAVPLRSSSRPDRLASILALLDEHPLDLSTALWRHYLAVWARTHERIDEQYDVVRALAPIPGTPAPRFTLAEAARRDLIHQWAAGTGPLLNRSAALLTGTL